MSRICVSLALLLSTLAMASEERPYWLVLASFQQRSAADAFVTRATGEIVEPLQILTGRGPDGRDRYRVVAGPFVTMSAATEHATSLHDAYPEAWIMAAAAPATHAETRPTPTAPSGTASDAPEGTEAKPAESPLRVPEKPSTGFNRLYRQP